MSSRSTPRYSCTKTFLRPEILVPLDLRVRRLHLLGEPLRGLGQGLEAPQDRFAGLGVVEEIAASRGRVASDAIDTLSYMNQIELVSFIHKGRAFDRTLSRMTR